MLIANPNSNRTTTNVLVHRLRRSMTALCPTGDIPLVMGFTAPSGPAMITTPDDLARAASHLPNLVGAAAKGHHAVAVVVGAFGDPGVARLRDRLSIPVIGIGEASLREVNRYGMRFGIVTTTGDLVDDLTQMVATHLLTDAFTGVEVTTSDPLALAEQPEKSCAELADAVERALPRGADTVIVGGGPLSSVADYLEPLFPGAIVDPVHAAARWAIQFAHTPTPHPTNTGGELACE